MTPGMAPPAAVGAYTAARPEQQHAAGIDPARQIGDARQCEGVEAGIGGRSLDHGVARS